MIRLIIMSIAAIVVVAAVVLGALWRDLPLGVSAPEDRLTDEEMSGLVEQPIGQVQAGDIEGGRRTFERMLRAAQARHGPNALEAADLLTAFGVLLDQQDQAVVPGAKPLAPGYLRRAIPIYRAALGPNHPEVALALSTLADALRFARPENPPAEAEQALVEAYRIRLASRGPTHAETLWTILRLAEVRGVPARTGGDPARIDAALGELDRAIRLSRHGDAESAERIPVAAYLRRAIILARHGRPGPAMRAFSAADRRARGSSDTQACMMPMLRVDELAEILEAKGEAERARVLRDTHIGSCG
jgi:hypothetical protein